MALSCLVSGAQPSTSPEVMVWTLWTLELGLTCARVGLEWLVAGETLARPVVPVHEGVVSTHRVGEVVAVVVREARVLQGHHLPDGVVAAAGLGDPHVSLLAPAGLQDLVTLRITGIS